MVIAAVGDVGLGVFAENVFLPLHGLFTLFAVFALMAAAVMSYKFLKSPFSYVAVILGIVSLLATIIGLSGFYFGLGLGGMERLGIYPILLWLLGFGTYLIGDSSGTAKFS